MSAACALLLVCCADASTAFATLRDGTRVVPGAVAAYRVSWAPMDAHYDRFFIGDRVYDAVAGREAYRENLLAHFPRSSPLHARLRQGAVASG